MYLLPPTCLRSCPGHFKLLSEERHGVSEKAQQANALAAKPDDLRLMPRANMVEGGTDPERCPLISMCTSQHTHT